MMELLELLKKLLERLGLKKRILGLVVLGVGLVMSVVEVVTLSSKVGWCDSAQGQLSQIYSSDITNSCSTATEWHTQGIVGIIVFSLGFAFVFMKAMAAPHPVELDKADTSLGHRRGDMLWILLLRLRSSQEASASSH